MPVEQLIKGLSLRQKVERSKRTIRKFHKKMHGKTYIGFSGGKDSTVLLDLVRDIYPDTPAVFCDTGLEYPSLKEHVKRTENVTVIRPKMNFKKVLEKYGYPVVSKSVAQRVGEMQKMKANPTEKNKVTRRIRMKGIKSDGTKTQWGKIPEKWKFLIDAPFKISEKCCDVMKKRPFKRYEKKTKRKPYLGMMANDSRRREQVYRKHRCIRFDEKKKYCWAVAIWTEKDIWDYIEKKELKYPNIYDKGMRRTGCMFCMFGCHLEDNDRFKILKEVQPKLYKYCMKKLKLKEVIDFVQKGEKE